MTQEQRQAADLLQYLNAKGVPFIIKTEYQNGEAVTRKVLPVTLQKKGHAWYAEGVIVRRWAAVALVQFGWAKAA